MTGVGNLITLLQVALVWSADPNSTLPFTVGNKMPTYSGLSYFGGCVIMLFFVVVPVGMMAYRNRNSIVEFIKNR